MNDDQVVAVPEPGEEADVPGERAVRAVTGGPGEPEPVGAVPGPPAADLVDLSSVLADLGVDQEEIDRAASENMLPLLAIQRISELDAPTHDLNDVARRSNIDPDVVRAYWRALGFPDPRPGEKVFRESDLELLDLTFSTIANESLERDVALQLSRVIGSAMDRVATALIDAITAQLSTAEVSRVLEAGGEETAELLSIIPRMMDFVWRRQLAMAARRRMSRASSEASRHGVLVGFADMVGFTARTQQLDDHELAEVVGRFEYTAFEVVAEHGGRVVKMIGDEVMFIHEDLWAGADLALDLAARFRDDDKLSDVRVGLASGSVLERDGDVFGHVVNVASRIVAVAYPGAVVASQEVHDALVDNEELRFRSLRSHYLKDVGKVALWSLRRPADDAEFSSTGARSIRSEREFLRERLLELDLLDSGLADELPPELREELLAGDMGDEPSTGQYEALTEAVLLADIEPNTQIELLAELEVDRRLRSLEAEAQAKASAADVEAERRLDEIDRAVRHQVHQIEMEARQRIDEVLAGAEAASRKANEDASQKVRKVAEETERKADKATKEAKAEAERRTRTNRRRRNDDGDGGGGRRRGDSTWWHG